VSGASLPYGKQEAERGTIGRARQGIAPKAMLPVRPASSYQASPPKVSKPTEIVSPAGDLGFNT
jgi:hypothetical protein